MLLTVIGGNVAKTIYALQILFDIDYPGFIRSAYFFMRFQEITYALLTLIEIMYIKFWLRFVRQRMISMDDSYIATCLTAQNIMISTLYSMFMVKVGKWLEIGTLPLIDDIFGL